MHAAAHVTFWERIHNPVDAQVATRKVMRLPRRNASASSSLPPAGATKTDEVWPWSHLIPFFAHDIRSRVRGGGGGGGS